MAKCLYMNMPGELNNNSPRWTPNRVMQTRALRCRSSRAACVCGHTDPSINITTMGRREWNIVQPRARVPALHSCVQYAKYGVNV